MSEKREECSSSQKTTPHPPPPQKKRKEKGRSFAIKWLLFSCCFFCLFPVLSITVAKPYELLHHPRGEWHICRLPDKFSWKTLEVEENDKRPQRDGQVKHTVKLLNNLVSCSLRRSRFLFVSQDMCESLGRENESKLLLRRIRQRKHEPAHRHFSFMLCSLLSFLFLLYFP